MDKVDEIIENIKAIEGLLDLANVPEQYVLRVLIAYVVVCTGTTEEQEVLYVANHTENKE